jgi:hypothetical protein
MIIKNNKLYLKIGSLGWVNFYGIPSFITGIGVIAMILGLLRDSDLKVLTFYVLIILGGIILCVYQNNKLKFKSQDLSIPTDIFIEKAKKILINEGWTIEYDNNEYLQAINRTGQFRLDLLTIKRFKQKIKYNLVHHPEDNNSIASLIDLNLKAKKTIVKLIACT